MSTLTDHEQVSVIVRTAKAWIDSQVLLPQGRCVDVLLDLYSAAQDPSVRRSISQHLAEISHVSTVLADDMLAGLAAIVALTTDEESPDLTWAEAQFTEPSHDDARLSQVIRWATSFRPPA